MTARAAANVPGEAILDRPQHPILAMVTIAFGAWLFVMSGAIANIALPYLAAELEVPEADIVWLTVAFQIAAVSCTIPLAGLSEVIGIRRVYVGGLVVYGLGAVACGLAHDFSQLALARVLQGLGAAGISSVNAALVRRIVPPKMLGRGIASLSVVLGAAQGAAPIVGSTILEIANWRWLFFYDLPLVLATIAMAFLAIPKDRVEGTRFDYVSAALCVPGLGLLFFSLDRLARRPTEAQTYVYLAFGVAAMLALILRQRGRERPLFPTDLFRLPRFAVPAGISVCMYAAQGLGLAALPFLLVRSLDMSLIEAGVMISVMPLATLVTVPVAGYMVDRFWRWPFSALGACATSSGFVLVLLVAGQHDKTLLTVAIALMGIGFALFQGHNAKAMILGAPISRMGAAGGVQSSMRVIGMMLGPAMVGISFHAFGEAGTTVALAAGVGVTMAGAALGFIYTWLNRRGGGEAVG